MNPNIIKLIKKLNNTFQESPWQGESILTQLKKIELQYVNETLSNSKNSIAILIQHLINWRVFAIEKLNNNEAFNIEMNSEADWKKISITTKIEWNALLNELTSTQNQILDILENQKNDAFLTNKTLGKDYSFEFLIEGIIQHDLYHLGQIGLLHSYLKKSNERS